MKKTRPTTEQAIAARRCPSCLKWFMSTPQRDAHVAKQHPAAGRTRILPRTCPVCGSNQYHGTLQAHYAARHPAMATPMRAVR